MKERIEQLRLEGFPEVGRFSLRMRLSMIWETLKTIASDPFPKTKYHSVMDFKRNSFRLTKNPVEAITARKGYIPL